MPRLSRNEIAARIARELHDGWYVNLGIGIPTLVANFVPEGMDVIFHSENGILGIGPKPETGQEDIDLVNAGKEMVTLVPGGCFFGQDESFAMIRGRHLDAAVLGAFEVSEAGDLANWSAGTGRLGSIGGAMDLAVGAKRVFVAMEHVTREGQPKILRRCTFPLTAPRCVHKIFTDLGVIDVTEQGLLLVEVAPGVTADEVQAATEAPLRVSPSLGVVRPMASLPVMAGSS